MYIHQDTVDQVRDQMQILEVVQEFLSDLKKVGSSYRAISPFTDEKTPSFYVSPSKNIYKCFSSGKGGDCISFLMEAQGMKFPEAISWLADKFGIIQKSYTPTEEEKEELDLKERLYSINEAALNRWKGHLWDTEIKEEYHKVDSKNWPYGNYIQTNWQPSVHNPELEENPVFRELIYKRRLTLETVLEFELGYALDQWRGLAAIVKEKALSADAATLGLVASASKGGYFDKLRHRIIFPIKNHQGRIVGFGGGALYYENEGGKKNYYEYIDGQKFINAQGEAQKVGKYINSQETPLYDKSNNLYGIHLAKEAIQKAGCAFVVEGYFDVITPHQRGLGNVVGTLGTELSRRQIKLLLRYTDRIIIMYDGDPAGRVKAIKASELLIKEGLSAEMVELPEGEDPDSFFREHPSPIDWVKENIRNSILCKADQELVQELNDYERENCFQDLARLIAEIDGESIKDSLVKEIGKTHGFTVQTFRKMVADHAAVRERKNERERLRKRKNEVVKLEGQPNVYPFFEEKYTKEGDYKGFDINRVRFVKLLSSFGYSRFSIDENDAKRFVRINDNLIEHVQRDEIIDHFEDFVNNEYDFEAAGFNVVDAEMLLNKFYSGIRSYFNADLFGRVRNSQDIIVNKDNKESIFFYYKNGFVEVTEKGWELKSYHEMEGGIWADQVNQRDFSYYEIREKEIRVDTTGVFSDFIWKISDQDSKRFLSLCTILGYLVHDFYKYKLRLVNFTDSSLSRASDGRSGKTLLTKMIGFIRNVGEINGKEFHAGDKNKYADLDIHTQITVINDIITKGPKKLWFEDLFNDITEGQMVKKLYMDAFRIVTKMIINSNGPLDIEGGSARDRIIEFELSTYFNTKHSPADEYGIYLGHDFDQREWMLYDNFMCYCAYLFLKEGIFEANQINLGRRKLIMYVNEYSLKFLDMCKQNLEAEGTPWKDFQPYEDWPQKPDFTNIKIDKSLWYNKMTEVFPEINPNHVTQHKFTKYLKLYAEHELGIQNPIDKRSGGVGWFIFQEETV